LSPGNPEAAEPWVASHAKLPGIPELNITVRHEPAGCDTPSLSRRMTRINVILLLNRVIAETGKKGRKTAVFQMRRRYNPLTIWFHQIVFPIVMPSGKPMAIAAVLA